MNKSLVLLTVMGAMTLTASEVRFEDGQLSVDGKPFQIMGGEMHPQRVPVEYWQHRIRMMKAMGLNTVSSYFFWNDFERTDGTFDFKTGNRNVAMFLSLCRDEGMKVLFRPGPYCCGEWDFGGLPARMLAKKGYLIRTTKNPDYLRECERYLKAIGDVARPFLWQNGGPIVLIQIENEYGSWRAPDRTPELITWTKNFWKREGFGPFYMADGVGDYFYRNLPYPDPEIAVGMDPGMDDKHWEIARKINPGVPVFSSETYPGWLRHWGEGNWRASDISKTVSWYVETKKSFCLFVAHGGTSFGFTAGANDGEGKGKYEPDLTSYDYGAPISEQGLPTPEYYRYRDAIGAGLGGVERLPPVPDPIPTMAIPAFEPAFLAPLTVDCGTAIASERCLHFEAFGQNQGMAVYETTVPAGEQDELRFDRIADYAKILLDGKCVATIDRRLGQQSCQLPKRSAKCVLSVIVEAMGHVNFDVGMQDDRKGISGTVVLGEREIKNWKVLPKPLDAASVVRVTGSPRVSDAVGGHFRGCFDLQKTADTYIDMSKWSKGTVYVNGHNLGRYWKIGPQFSLYCPASWLKVGRNQVDIIEMDINQPRAVCGTKANVVFENRVETKYANNVW